MRHARRIRFAVHLVLLALFAAATFAAGRFLMHTLLREGPGPRAFFALLLLAGGVALAWRGALDLRAAARRLRR